MDMRLLVSIVFGLLGTSLVNMWDGVRHDGYFWGGYIAFGVAVGLFLGLVIISN